MIPAYKEEVKITIKEENSSASLEEQVQELRNRVNQLYETIEYMNRERSRMKSEIDTLRSQIRNK